MAYDPTQADVAAVRVLLLRAGLVADLIDDILDYAEYWLRATSHAVLDVSIHARRAPGLSEEFHGNKFLLRSWPIGLTGADMFSTGDDQREYQTQEIAPVPLSEACDTSFFREQWPRPPPRLDHPARKIVFRLTSHDQGWTTHSTKGAFHDACTWFDAGIERFERGSSWDVGQLRPVEPPPVQDAVAEHRYALRERFNDWEIQRGRVAQGEWESYTVTWRREDDVRHGSAEGEALFRQGKNPRAYDGRFVRALRAGDVITVWGRSVQAGWTNVVRSVEIDVYWAA